MSMSSHSGQLSEIGCLHCLECLHLPALLCMYQQQTDQCTYIRLVFGIAVPPRYPNWWTASIMICIHTHMYNVHTFTCKPTMYTAYHNVVYTLEQIGVCISEQECMCPCLYCHRRVGSSTQWWWGGQSSPDYTGQRWW